MAAINQVMLSDAVINNRFSAEFFDPKYVFEPLGETNWLPIGRILKKCEYGVSIAMNTHGKGFPIFRMNELENCFALRPEKYAAIPNIIFEQYRLQFNDVLFNRTNSFEFVGRTGIVKDQTDCTFASYLIRLVPDSARILPEYLTVYLNTRFGIGQIKRRAMRSINQANVSASEIRRVLIPIFEIAVQQKIAELVNASFQATKESQSTYSKAQQLLESELGLDKLSFHKPVGYAAHLSEAVTGGRFDADYFQPQFSTIQQLIKGYSNGFELLIDCVTPLKPNIDPSDTPSQLYNYIELSNINASLGTVDDFETKIGQDLPSRARRQVQYGDVIASAVVGSIDKAAIVDHAQDGFIASTGFFHLRPRTISSEFLLMLVRSKCVRMQFQQQSTGGILSAVPDSRLKHVIIPKLPQTLQSEITELVKLSHSAKRQSQKLLEQAKARVEQLIEEAVQS
jgi:type I restriction enzyme, S subunit